LDNLDLTAIGRIVESGAQRQGVASRAMHHRIAAPSNLSNLW
jgi:hypothetical protein